MFLGMPVGLAGAEGQWPGLYGGADASMPTNGGAFSPSNTFT